MAEIWNDSRRSTTTSASHGDHRSPFEHDYDRLLFSTPVRRLADKTQVFPLDRNDGVRTRLTHSHEVSNLARSMGNRLTRNGHAFSGIDDPRAIPAILSTIGLAHDLGNPPFGHQGEAAIGRWFIDNPSVFTHTGSKKLRPSEQVPDHLRPEFVEFEGNAQTIRIVSRLQVAVGGYGLDFAAATLAALMKYSVPCDKRGKNAATKKYGYFESETELVSWVRDRTHIPEGQRHPLTWIMEAADDIAYSVLDIEDAMKKGIISPDDVCAIIVNGIGRSHAISKHIYARFKKSYGKKRSIHETREIKISYLRTIFIQSLVDETILTYESNLSNIMNLERTLPLLEKSELCNLLKRTAKKYVFSTPAVREIEANGNVAVNKLMGFFWNAIIDREDPKDLGSRRKSAQTAYGFSLISDNYLQCALRGGWLNREGKRLPMRYRELRLLTDMMAGMTDGFATDTYAELRSSRFVD